MNSRQYNRRMSVTLHSTYWGSPQDTGDSSVPHL